MIFPQMPKVKLYLVKYEVKATSLRRALNTKGEGDEVQLAEEKVWAENNNIIKGLNKTK